MAVVLYLILFVALMISAVLLGTPAKMMGHVQMDQPTQKEPAKKDSGMATSMKQPKDSTVATDAEE